jgi:hypothetical protein
MRGVLGLGHHQINKIRYGRGIDVMGKEWDTLILLDACRFDAFSDLNSLHGSLSAVTSRGSTSREFLLRNFADRKLHDTVYVTSSPQVVGYEFRFHDVIHVWDSQWDKELRTVRPDSVTNAALEAANEYPDKKLIIHYMQPHYPFIGPTGRELETHATFTGGLREREHLSIWELLSAGSVSMEEMRTAYEENLELVLEEVTGLVDELNGKTIVTSDHGNLFGERVSPLPIRLYGHPPNVPAENLIQVPLVELPFESFGADLPAERRALDVVRVEAGVDVDHAETVFQFQHRSVVPVVGADNKPAGVSRSCP